MPPFRAKHYEFHIQSPTIVDINALSSITCSYVCYGYEATQNLQFSCKALRGFVSFDVPRRLASYNAPFVNATVWPSVASGFKTSIALEGFTEFGDRPARVVPNSKGTKRKFGDLWDLAKSGQFDQLDPRHYIAYKAIHEDFNLLSSASLEADCPSAPCGLSQGVDIIPPVLKLARSLVYPEDI